MSKAALFFACVIYSCICNAQIELRFSDFAVPGENFIMAGKHYAISDNFILDKNGTKEWDFSMVPPVEFDTIRCVKPNQTRHGKAFPEAEFAIRINSVNAIYYKLYPDYLEKVGFIDDFLNLDASVIISFSNFVKQHCFPAKVGMAFSDTATKNFVSKYYMTPGVDSIKCDIFVVEEITYDAEGTIKTPMGTYQVLRQKHVLKKNIKASKYTMFGWTPAPEYTQKRVVITYKWFSKNGKYQIAEAEVTPAGIITCIKYQYIEPMQLFFVVKNVKCKGGNTGAIDLSVKGGVPDYTYQWTVKSTVEDLYNVPAGTYTVTVTDNKGTEIKGSQSIAEPQVSLTMEVTKHDVRCYGERNGSLEVLPKGGVPPYFVVWSNDSTQLKIEKLKSGIYGVIVRDENHCYIFDSVTVTAPTEPLSAYAKIKPVNCYGGNDGSADLEINGGTPPYKVKWTNGDTSRYANKFKVGEYTATITDAHGCIKTVNIKIKQPESPLKAVLESTPVKCYGDENGTINSSITGGSPPYNYQWSNDTQFPNPRNLSAGKYLLTVTDRNGCIISDSITVAQPSNPLKIEIKKQDVNCFAQPDGYIEIIASGGTPDYTYKWMHGNEKKTVTELRSGSYTVTISDRNNCRISETIEISQPEAPLTIMYQKKDISCFNGKDGEIDITIIGGTPEYTYSWSNLSKEEDLVNLSPGKYTFTVFDKNKCQAVKDIYLSAPDSVLNLNFMVKDVTCFDGNDGYITVSATGGSPKYTFRWWNNIEINKMNKLSAGEYSVKLIDARNCQIEKTIIVNQPPKINIEPIVTNPKQGKNSGEILLIISGGVEPYSILWNNGKTDPHLQNLKAGDYQVTVKDNNNCTIEKKVKLINE